MVGPLCGGAREPERLPRGARGERSGDVGGNLITQQAGLGQPVAVRRDDRAYGFALPAVIAWFVANAQLIVTTTCHALLVVTVGAFKVVDPFADRGEA